MKGAERQVKKNSVRPADSEIERIVNTYADSLYRMCMVSLCNRFDAEDAVSETIMRFIRYSPVFRDKELVVQQPYGKVYLTEYGRQTAAQYERYVNNLAVCLIRAGLPLSTQGAQQAACVLLAELPEACIRKMEKVVDN